MNARLASLVAAALLLAAAGPAASDPPTQCITSGGTWTVTATAPFAPANCPGGGTCTDITYNIAGPIPDHVTILASHGVSIVSPPSNFISAPCIGDNVTLLGTRDCSTQAVRLNQNLQKSGPFDLIAHDTLQAVDSSIVVKKGSVFEDCLIESLGHPFEVFDPHAQVTTSQTYNFEGCSVTIPTDVETGEGGVASITGNGCVFVANGQPVGNAQLLVNGQSVGFGTNGTGAFSTGTDSCTTRVINNKLYTWCTCTGTTDPKPPCP